MLEGLLLRTDDTHFFIGGSPPDGFDLFLEVHVDTDNLDTFSERSEFEDGRYIIASRPCFVWEDLIINHQ